MRIARSLDAWEAPPASGSVFTVGVFDGVHRGHRQLLYELTNWARAASCLPAVLTFATHPLSELRGVTVPMILTLENRLVEFERHGVEATVVTEFAPLREKNAEQFLADVVRDRLGCRRFLLGFDSAVGKDREGDATRLAEIGARVGVEVRVASPVLDRDGTKIGSSSIRAAVVAGDLVRAGHLLGRPFALRGPVVRGAGRGKDLGAATANVAVVGHVLPPDGVYVVRVFRDDKTAVGVANLGVRPTFGDGSDRTLEVHIPGWQGDMYGDHLEVRFGDYLRPERKFDSPDALRAQIARDLEALVDAQRAGRI